MIATPFRRSQLDVAFPLPYLRHVRRDLLGEADNETAELDQGLVADGIVEEEIRVQSTDRYEGHVRGRSPENEVEVEHRPDRAGVGKVPKQVLGAEVGGRIGNAAVLEAGREVCDERERRIRAPEHA